MILIADSGATKTDWLLVNRDNNIYINTAGINPYYMPSEEIEVILVNELLPQVPAEEITSIHYYGSGCSTEAKCKKISSILNRLFIHASVEVNHDLLAAARSLCDHKPGIACILGTGSNSCVYDGKLITRQMVSLGYFFGDEGSGTHMGKLLITDYLRKEMPEHISEKLNENFNLSLEYVLDRIYNQQFPNRFLASFAPFIQQNSKDQYIRQLVASSFSDFLKAGVMSFTGFKELKVNFVGSVAHHFQDILLEVIVSKGLKPGIIRKSVIEGLKDFHVESTIRNNH